MLNQYQITNRPLDHTFIYIYSPVNSFNNRNMYHSFTNHLTSYIIRKKDGKKLNFF